MKFTARFPWIEINRIGTKLLIPIALMIAAFMVASTYGLYRFQEKYFYQQTVKEADTLSTVIMDNVKADMLSNNSDQIGRILENVAENGDIVSLMLIDKDGKVKVSGGDVEVGAEFSIKDPQCIVCHQKDIATRERAVLSHKDGGSGARLTHVSVIENDEQCMNCHGETDAVLGVLLMEVSMDDARALMHSGRVRLLATELLTLLGVLCFTWVSIFYLVRKPVEKLLDGVNRISRGDLAHKVQITGVDEIAQLGKSFNRMGRKLEKYIIAAGEQRSAIEELEKLRRESEESKKALDKKLSEMETLNEIGKLLGESHNPGELMHVIAEVVGSRLGMSDFALLLLDEEGEYLRIRTSFGLPEDIAGEIKFRVGEGISGKVMLTGEPMIVADVSRNPSFKFYMGARRDIKSFMCVPLISKGKVIGVMNVHHPEAGAFGDEDLVMFTAVASQFAVAIENSLAFDLAGRMLETDPVSGLANHGAFQRKLHSAVASPGKGFALMYLDLDNFGAFNKTSGHEAGDKLLGEIGRVISAACSEGDTPARIGGDEFAVIMPGATADAAMLTAQRMLFNIKNAVSAVPGTGAQQAVTASLGIATYKPGADASVILDRAIMSCRRAHEIGGNRAVVFS